MTVGQFLKECSNYEYSKERYDLMKECSELQLMEEFILDQKYMKENVMNDDYYSESVDDESLVLLQESFKEKIMILRKKIMIKIVLLIQKLMNTLSKFIKKLERFADQGVVFRRKYNDLSDEDIDKINEASNDIYHKKSFYFLYIDINDINFNPKNEFNEYSKKLIKFIFADTISFSVPDKDNKHIFTIEMMKDLVEELLKDKPDSKVIKDLIDKRPKINDIEFPLGIEECIGMQEKINEINKKINEINKKDAKNDDSYINNALNELLNSINEISYIIGSHYILSVTGRADVAKSLLNAMEGK